MAGPVLSHRQRFDESNARSVTNLMSALQAIKAAKDDEEAKRRAGVQDQLANQQLQQGQQTLAQNEMALGKQKQEAGYVSAFNDQIDREMNPGAMNEPAMPGMPSAFDPTPFTEKGLKSKGDDFKYSIIAKRRTLGGKESTPDMVRQEYEAASAQNADAMAQAAGAPDLRKLELRMKTAEATGKESDNKKTKLEIDKLEAEIKNAGKPGKPGEAITKDNQIIWDKLWGGYRTDSKSVKASMEQIRKVRAMVEGVHSGATDMGTVFSFIRVLDSPESAVREADVALTREAVGVLNNLLATPQRVMDGKLLPEEARRQILEATALLEQNFQQGFNSINSRYSFLSERAGLDPSLVVDKEYMERFPSQKPGAGSGPLKIGRFQVEAAD